MWQLVVQLVLLRGAINQVNALPSNLEPLSYNLTISTHLNGGPNQNRYVGLVSIRLLVRQETRQVILNYRDIVIDSDETMLIRKKSGFRIGINDTKTLKQQNEYVISVQNRLIVGEEYTLYLVFSGNMAKPHRHGYYASFYKDNNSSIGQQLYSFARFDPQFARTAFPCFDEPKFRSNYTLYMAHSSEYVSLSNMPASSTWKHPTIDGYMWTKFEESPTLATHMFTWMLHQLKLVAQTEGYDGTKVNIWARPHLKTNSPMVKEALRATTLLLKKSQQLFGIPLPLGNTTERKMDQVVLPRHPKTVYKRGLLVYSENMLRKGTGQKQLLYQMLAEYFVHQWNGILVSVSTWDDKWIFNGLTTYLSIQLVNQMEPFSNYNQSRLLDLSLWVMREDLMEVSTKDIAHHKYPQLETLRGKKGCLIFNILHSVIGLDVMEMGLRNFWRKYANTTATGINLWTELQQTSRQFDVLPKGIDLDQVINSWLYQSGYPLIVVQRNYENNTVILTQQQYSAITLRNNKCWWIPINYMSQSQRTPHKEWFSCYNNNPQIAFLTLSNVIQRNDWLLINVNGSILHRTLYDIENWFKLNKTLRTDFEEIPPINRAYLVDDALNFAWMGMLPYSLALDIVAYLANETNILVWQVAIRNLDRLHSILYPTTGYRIFKIYMRNIVENHLKLALNGFNKMSEESTNNTINRTKKINVVKPSIIKLPRYKVKLHSVNSIIYHLACRFEVTECIKDASDRYQKVVSNTQKEIPEEIRETVYCMAVRYGMEIDWLLVRDKYIASKSLNDRRILLKSLACSVDHWALQKLLTWTFDKQKVSKLLTVDLLKGLSKNIVAFGLVKKYFIHNIDEIKKMYDNDEIVALLRPIVNAISSQDDLNDIMDLIKKHLPRVSRFTVKNLLQKAVANVDWHRYRYFPLLNSIRQFLIHL